MNFFCSMDDKVSNPVSTARQKARKLRITGSIFVLLGAVTAGAVYWNGARSRDMSDDPSMAGYDRPAQRQMAMLYGKQGELIERWWNDLQQPGTQAAIIVALTAFVAGSCFYFARLLDADADP